MAKMYENFRQWAVSFILDDDGLLQSPFQNSFCQFGLPWPFHIFPVCLYFHLLLACPKAFYFVKFNFREATKAALLYSQAHLEAKGERPVMIPRCCGWSCTMCYRSGRCKPCFATSQRPHGCLNQNIAVNNNAFSPDFTVPATSEMTVSRIQNDAYHGCCACCPCPAPVDAIDYYTQEAEDLRKKLDAEGNRAVKTKIGIAFITFHTRESAARSVSLS